MNVLVINAGSSSLKYQLVNVEQQELLAKRASASAWVRRRPSQSTASTRTKRSSMPRWPTRRRDGARPGIADERADEGHRLARGNRCGRPSHRAGRQVLRPLGAHRRRRHREDRRAGGARAAAHTARRSWHQRLPEAHAEHADGCRVRYVVLPDAAPEGLHVPPCPTSCTRSTPSASTARTARATATSPSAPPPCWTSRSGTSSSSRATWATAAPYRHRPWCGRGHVHGPHAARRPHDGHALQRHRPAIVRS